MAEPLIVSTWSFAVRANATAWPALERGGSSLDAVETVCRATEADPDVDSVGLGGLPDAEGRVSLDACVMLGPDRCGVVADVREHLHAVTIARGVMERTRHVTLTGAGADVFADEIDVPRRDLLASAARERWEAWRRDPSIVDQSRDVGQHPGTRPWDAGAGPGGGHDTICTLAIDRAGMLAGACSTSGMPFKRPGRVGDVGAIGHGLYVDPAVGAATATGTGELVMATCGSFLAVEAMRSGRAPLEALALVLERVRDVLPLEPEHQVGMIAVRPDGTPAVAALRRGFKAVVTTTAGSEVREPDLVLLER